MMAFAALAAGATLCGRGALRLLRSPLDDTSAWLVSPLIGLALAALFLYTGVSFGLPVRVLAAPFWGLALAGAVYALLTARRSFTPQAGWLLAIALAMAAALMMADIRRGLTNYVGHSSGDGWSYVAFGNYLWEVPKGAPGPLPPLQQYASHLAHTRFITSALLAVASPLGNGGGDTQSTTGAFILLSLFVFGAAVAAVGHRIGLPLWATALAVVSALGSPWVLGAIEVHNYDNLIALGFAPVLVVMLTPPLTLRMGALAGVVLAASICVYVEFAVFPVIVCVVALMRHVLAHGLRPTLAPAAVGIVVCGLGLAPAASELSGFLQTQSRVAAAAVGTRPGEGNFVMLAQLRSWPQAAWRLTDDEAIVPPRGATLAQAVSWIVSLLVIAGVVVLTTRGQIELAVVALASVAGALHFAGRAHYGYGAYKFLLMGWWTLAVALAAVVGLTRRTKGGIAVAAIASLLAVGMGPALSLVRMARNQAALASPSIAPYRYVRDLIPAIGGRAVLVAVDDPAANAWAVYFLRDQAIRLVRYRSYMAFPHVAPLMAKARQPPIEHAQFVLLDRRAARTAPAVAGVYALQPLRERGDALLLDAANPNGAEQLDNRPFYWLDTRTTVLHVFATSAVHAQLTGRFFPGPTPTADGPPRLAIRRADGIDTITRIDRDGEYSIGIDLQAGDNVVELRALGTPIPVPSHDPRALMIGLQNPSVSVRER